MGSVIVKKFGLPETLEFGEYPTSKPGVDDVLVEVRAAGVNYPDLLVIDGTYQFLPPLPFVPGKECAGIVKVAGSNVTSVKPGDRVMVQVEYGAYAQQVVAKGANCYPIPDAMSYVDAAAMGLSYLTAYFALVERARLHEGETVLVTGAAGGVGLAAVQIAKVLNATVIAVVRSPEKAVMTKNNGAAHTIDMATPHPQGTFQSEVMNATQGNGIDVMVDQVGGELFHSCLSAMAYFGRIVVIGFVSGQITTFKSDAIMEKDVSILGLQISDYRDREPEKFQAAWRRLVLWFVEAKLKPQVMSTYPLQDAATALNAVKRGLVLGKVVLTME